ncbi:MAG: hypothetical protein QOE04_651, partial [Mycobacterium sp.]|nr:hypothetical protein [Mycobacterium sp.]
MTAILERPIAETVEETVEAPTTPERKTITKTVAGKTVTMTP